MRYEFMRRAHPFVSEATYIPREPWDYYFLMQHFGMPTRLLDWTESALVAIYFTVRTSLERDDGCVWMLNPRSLARAAKGYDNILSASEAAEYLPPIWSHQALPPLPAAIQPPFNSRRLAAQRGAFTIHGSDPAPLDSHAPLRDALAQIIIRRSAKSAMRDELDTAGITESLVFPDLAGLCRELTGLCRPEE